jgi:hypothetical protein
MRRTAAPFRYVIPSNASIASLVDRTGSRTARALFRASVSMTCSMPAIWPIVAPKVGFHWSTIFASAHVAKPSFSQMSFHHFIVTRSPNH